MTTGLDDLERGETRLAQNLQSALQLQTDDIVNGVTALLKHGAIEDETDKTILTQAVAFIRSPSENLEEIKGHTTAVGQVIGGYTIKEKDAPTEIDAMHAYLLTLQCINRIDFIEAELEKGTPVDSQNIKLAMTNALDWANILLKYYTNNTPLAAVNELQERLKEISQS